MNPPRTGDDHTVISSDDEVVANDQDTDDHPGQSIPSRPYSACSSDSRTTLKFESPELIIVSGRQVDPGLRKQTSRVNTESNTEIHYLYPSMMLCIGPNLNDLCTVGKNNIRLTMIKIIDTKLSASFDKLAQWGLIHLKLTKSFGN